MLWKWTIFLALSLLTTLADSKKERFDDYRLYGIDIDTSDQLHLFHDLQESSDGFLLWNYPVIGDTVDVMVAPHKLSEFNRMTELYDLRYRLKIKNVQRFTSETLVQL